MGSSPLHWRLRQPRLCLEGPLFCPVSVDRFMLKVRPSVDAGHGLCFGHPHVIPAFSQLKIPKPFLCPPGLRRQSVPTPSSAPQMLVPRPGWEAREALLWASFLCAAAQGQHGSRLRLVPRLRTRLSDFQTQSFLRSQDPQGRGVVAGAVLTSAVAAM